MFHEKQLPPWSAMNSPLSASSLEMRWSRSSNSWKGSALEVAALLPPVAAAGLLLTDLKLLLLLGTMLAVLLLITLLGPVPIVAAPFRVLLLIC